MTTVRVQEDPFIATHQYEKFVDVSMRALAFPSIAIAYGMAGVGKSVAAQHYATNNEAVIYCSLAPHDRTSRDLYRVLLTSLLEVPFQSTPTAKMMVAVKQHLLERGVKLVIIDEADFLQDDGLEALRVLSDQCNISIVLIALPRILGRIQKMPQLQSRVAQTYHYDGLSKHQLQYEILPYWSNVSVITFTPDQEDANNIVDTIYDLVAGEDGVPFQKVIHILQAANEVIRIHAANRSTDDNVSPMSHKIMVFNTKLIRKITGRVLQIR